MESIVQAVYENSIRYPDKPALIYRGKTVTYRGLFEQICAFAASLKIKKIRKGSRIALEADDVLSYFPAFLGCHLAKMIAVPLEKNITENQLQKILHSLKPALVFSGHTPDAYGDFFGVYTEYTQSPVFPEAQDECAIISTTGTTGRPERIVHTNKSMLTAVENLTEGTGITAENTLFVCAPFNLAFGYRRVFSGLYAGASCVLSHSLDSPDDFFALAQNCRIDHLALIPSDLAALLRADSAKMNLLARQLKAVQTAIYPVSAKDKNEFLQRYPNVALYNVYGTTESGCCIIHNCIENPKDGCLGKPAPHAEIALFNGNGSIVRKCGEYGYIAVKGDMNMKCYYKKKALTDKVIVNGYVVTSDVAYYDKDGYLFFISRVSDIINVGGHKVIPDEIETMVSAFPGVRECACVAQKDPKYGQRPKVFVVFERENADNAAHLMAFLAEKLEPYKVPASIEAAKKIPRTSTGKIMRNIL